jgi:glucuronoarabinoxylan endo-1,4-beta-xylanase
LKNFYKLVAGLLVTVLLFGTAFSNGLVAKAAVPNKITMNWDQVYQEIDGFGVSQACDVYGEQIYGFGQRDTVMDLLFSQEKGIGLSMLRCEVGNGLNMPTIEPEDGVWNYDRPVSELWVIKEAKKRGIDKIFSTVWSPPAWMKTTGKITNGGYLKKDCYRKFAEYLAEYVSAYKRLYDIDINAVSIANEPEYAAMWQSCLWKPEMITDFLQNYLAPVFAEKKIPAKVIVGEKGEWSEGMVLNALNNPGSCERIDIIGGHQYSGTIAPLATAISKGKRTWETEVSDTGIYKNDIKDGVAWAERIHKFMSNANANAFMYWLGASYKTNNESLIRLYQDGTYVPAKRLYTMGNFSKFVKPGYVRIGINDNPIKGVYFSTYKNPLTNEFVIIAVNNTDTNHLFELSIDGCTAGSLTPTITNDKENLTRYEDVISENGTFKLSLGGYSVTTFTGINGSDIPQQKAWTITDELNDWKYIYSATPGWMLEGNDPYGGFEGDPSRARRTASNAQSLTYCFQNIRDFEAHIYFYKQFLGMNLYSSVDGEEWTTIPFIASKPKITGGYWEKTVIKPQGLLAPGTNYLKVEFNLGDQEWDKHLSKISFDCDGVFVPTIHDSLNDWSKVDSHSENWMLDANNAQSMEGDNSRAMRTTASKEFILYKAGENKTFSSFCAKLFYFRGNSSPIRFYRSEDGLNFQEILPQYTGSVDTGSYWRRMYAKETQVNCKYIKVEFDGGGLYPWDKQLGDIWFYEN